MKNNNLLFVVFLFSIVACTNINNRKNAEAMPAVLASSEPSGGASSNAYSGTASNGKFEVALADEVITNKNSDADINSEATANTQVNMAIENQQKLIRNANIKIQIENFDEAKLKIAAIVKKYNASINSENESNESFGISNSISIRCAPNQFDNLILEIMKLSVYTDSKVISTDDVTQTYIDIVARIKSKKAAEQEYLNIMKRASKVSDVIEVENNLRLIREEIESMQAQLNGLNNRIDLSTINLNYYERKLIASAPDDSFKMRVLKGFRTGWEGLTNTFIVLINLWPLILIAFLVWYIVRYLKNRKKLH